MRLDQDKKLRPRRLISRILWLLIFNTSQFLKGARSRWRAIFAFLPQKHILRRVFIFLLIFAWLFSGWPQIFNFPPKVQFIYASEYLLNPSFTGGTTDWTLSVTVYDATYYQDTAGSVRIKTIVGRNNTAIGNAEQTISTNINSTDTVTLNIYWSKQSVAVACEWNNISVDIAKPSTPTTWVTIWSDTSIPAAGAATAWAFVNQDISASFDETGQYKIRYYADLSNINNASAQCLAWFDNTSLDVTTAGTLTVDIVDDVGSSVASPSMAMGATTFSFNYQTANGTFGVSTEKIRVENTTANPQWNLTIAANGGSTAFWDSTGTDYDFNDPTASAGDGADADNLGGQMTMNASVGTLGGTCTATDITKGSSASFSEGVTDSVTLLTAGASADTGCYWDFTGVSVSQTIPAEQPAASDYSINMTLTVTAI